MQSMVKLYNNNEHLSTYELHVVPIVITIQIIDQLVMIKDAYLQF